MSVHPALQMKPLLCKLPHNKLVAIFLEARIAWCESQWLSVFSDNFQISASQMREKNKGRCCGAIDLREKIVILWSVKYGMC